MMNDTTSYVVAGGLERFLRAAASGSKSRIVTETTDLLLGWVLLGAKADKQTGWFKGSMVPWTVGSRRKAWVNVDLTKTVPLPEELSYASRSSYGYVIGRKSEYAFRCVGLQGRRMDHLVDHLETIGKRLLEVTGYEPSEITTKETAWEAASGLDAKKDHAAITALYAFANHCIELEAMSQPKRVA